MIGDKWLLISAELSLAHKSWFQELSPRLQSLAVDKAVAYFHARLTSPSVPLIYRMADAVRDMGGE